MENILESICHEAFQLVLNLLLLFFNLLLLLLDRYFHSALLRLKPAHQNVDKLTRVAPLQVDALDESKFVYGNLLHDTTKFITREEAPIIQQIICSVRVSSSTPNRALPNDVEPDIIMRCCSPNSATITTQNMECSGRGGKSF